MSCHIELKFKLIARFQAAYRSESAHISLSSHPRSQSLLHSEAGGAEAAAVVQLRPGTAEAPLEAGEGAGRRGGAGLETLEWGKLLNIKLLRSPKTIELSSKNAECYWNRPVESITYRTRCS